MDISEQLLLIFHIKYGSKRKYREKTLGVFFFSHPGSSTSVFFYFLHFQEKCFASACSFEMCMFVCLGEDSAQNSAERESFAQSRKSES